MKKIQSENEDKPLRGTFPWMFSKIHNFNPTIWLNFKDI